MEVVDYAQFLWCYFMRIHKNRVRRIAINKSSMYLKDLLRHKVLGSFTKWIPFGPFLKIAVVTMMALLIKESGKCECRMILDGVAFFPVFLNIQRLVVIISRKHTYEHT
jgi:hypothetical protein